MSSIARANGRAGDDLVLLREDLLEPPARDVREGEQAQRLTSGSAVDDHGVVLRGLVVAAQREQAEQLVEAGRHRQLFGGDPIDAAREQDVAEPVLDRRPVPLQLVLRVHLLAPQPLRHRRRLAAELDAERVREAVGGVGREHDRAQAVRRAAPRRGRGDRRLADAALAGVEDRARAIHKPASVSARDPRVGHP
jgi:hypothetical protein